jgi:hypothetical protein
MSSEPGKRLGAQHQIQVGQPLKRVFPFLLGHTPGHHGDQMGFFLFVSGKPPQKTEGFFLGLVADGAGVAHNDIRLFRVRRGPIPQGIEHRAQFFGIIHIHLAADGMNMGIPVIRHESQNPFSNPQ